MLTKKNHLELMVGSIGRMFSIAKDKGILSAKELFLINLIGRILTEEYYELSKDKYNKLYLFYMRLQRVYSSKVCVAEIKTNHIFSSYLEDTIVPDKCFTYDKKELILYWQEPYLLVNSDISDRILTQDYLLDKPSDTYPKFEVGKDIEYIKIGKVAFLALDSNTTNYIVKDQMNNNVTHTFNITLIPELGATLFVSDNIYAHGTMNFKIIKQ